MLILMLLLALQAAYAPPPEADGPDALWELTDARAGARPVVRRECRAAPDDEAYLKAAHDRLNPGTCEPAAFHKDARGWTREQRCVGPDGRAEILRAERQGDPSADAVFTAAVADESGRERWSVSTRYRRLGPCPGDPDETPKGPVRCPGKALRGSC